jgi:hypothetical protein
MKSATASGRDSMMTSLEWTVVVSALIVCAIMASSSGEMTRSSLATMYHDGFVYHAGAVAGVAKCDCCYRTLGGSQGDWNVCRRRTLTGKSFLGGEP